MPFSCKAPSGRRGASCEVLTTTIDQRASILQCLDRPIENALGLVKIGKMGENRERHHRTFTLTNSISVFLPKRLWQVSSNSIENCDDSSDDRQTPAIFYNLPVLCYSNGTDNNLHLLLSTVITVSSCWNVEYFKRQHWKQQDAAKATLGDSFYGRLDNA